MYNEWKGNVALFISNYFKAQLQSARVTVATRQSFGFSLPIKMQGL